MDLDIEENKAAYEYVIEYAKEAGVPAIARLFVLRCCEGEIYTEQTKRYKDNIDLQDTLRAFGLDSEKFWYLCLFVNDIVEGFTVDMETPLSPRTELANLISKLNELNCDFEKRNNSKLADFVCNGELSLKIDNKTVLSITAPNILNTIKDALQSYLKDKEDDWTLDIAMCARKHKDKSTTIVVSLFKKYLSYYLDGCIADKHITSSKGKNIAVSTDKMQLIGTMIYVLGIGDKRFMEKDFLKNYKHKGKIELTVPNRYYRIIDRGG